MSLNIIIKKEKLYSLVWFVPVIALCLAISLIYSSNFNKGPVITLILNKADGLEEGKTSIKALSVEVGKVKEISLSSDLKYVKAKVQMNLDTDNLLKDDTIFWIQKPRIDRQGVSGLSTIFSGYYIELKPGTSDTQRDCFDVLEDPPIYMDKDGLFITLQSNSSKMVSEGDSVTFKGMNVGSVISKNYDFDSEKMFYKIYINNPFTKLITKETKFWVSSGIDINVGADGVNVETDSIESILKGGISFDNFNEIDKSSKKIKNGQIFNLYKSKNDIAINYSKTIDYIVFLQKPSRNLTKDSPVFYQGLQVGIVKKAPYFPKGFKLFKDSIKNSAVLISIQSERFDKNEERSLDELNNDIKNLIKRNGLTANIETLNIITGRNYINLTENDGNSKGDILITKREFDGYTVIPSIEKDISTMQQDITSFVHNLGTLPLNDLIANINNLMKSSQKTSVEVAQLVDNINVIISKLDQNNVSEEMIKTLKELQKTISSYSSDSELYNNLNHSLNNLNSTLKSIEPVAQKLDSKTNSLVFSYEKEDPIPPKAKEVK